MKIKEWHIHYAVATCVTLLGIGCIALGISVADSAWGYIGLTAAGALMGYQLRRVWDAVRKLRKLSDY